MKTIFLIFSLGLSSMFPATAQTSEWMLPTVKVPLIIDDSMRAVIRPHFADRKGTLSFEGAQYHLNLRWLDRRCEIIDDNGRPVATIRGLASKQASLVFASGANATMTREGRRENFVYLYQGQPLLKVSDTSVTLLMRDVNEHTILAQAALVLYRLMEDYDAQKVSSTFYPVVVSGD